MIPSNPVNLTKQIKKETIQSGVIGFVAFILPVVTTNLVSVYIGIGLATVEIAAIFLAEYLMKRANKKKAIRV
jgi:hypothetical protein